MKVNIISIFFITCLTIVLGEDFYEILGVGKDATTREIRKAFKKLALKHHPDKSKEKDAQEKFLKINKAYETLKDEDKRKRYDQFGDEEEEEGGRKPNQNQGYQSWNYYHDDFGLYDDDPEIITLDYYDFRRSVSDAYEYWMINFYSPQCGHCHELAPTWRRVARKLDGIVRIGAVNCQDDFHLCRQQNIHAYPSVIFFGPSENLRFKGAKEEDELISFVAEQLPYNVHDLTEASFARVVKREGKKIKPWVIIFCSANDFVCPEKNDRIFLGHMLMGTVNVAHIDCIKEGDLCEAFKEGEKTRAFLFDELDEEPEKNRLEGQKLKNLEYRELSDEIMKKLPAVRVLDEEEYSNIRLKLEDGFGSTWLIHFVFGDDGRSVNEKKIPALIPSIKFAQVDCFDTTSACRELGLKKPKYAVFKKGGAYEIYHDREEPSDIAQFARSSAQARTMTTFTSHDINSGELSSGKSVFIDFFTPWCPPCLHLLPEFRKTSIRIGGDITFATIDCTVNPTVCNQFNIRSYPTTIFFNQSKPHTFHGEHSADALSEFVMDILRPSVLNLDYRGFHALLERKPLNEIWMVDFFAPWCGPCMQLAPEWNKLAKLLKKLPEVKIAKVDCTVEAQLCNEQFVRSYPTIRLYPSDSYGTNKYMVFTGFNRDAYSLRSWLIQHLPEMVENFTPFLFQQEITQGSSPFIVDFYTPWCGPCQHFAPVFEDIAISLRGRVRAAKINCDRHGQLCRSLGIQAYPTVKFYPGYTDRGEEAPSRNPETLVNFVEERLKHHESRKFAHDEL